MKEIGIKFNCNWIESQPLDASQIEKLNKWREKLYGLELIGESPDGIGYGNMSVRSKENTFIITGATTGKIKDLTSQHYTSVTEYDFKNNSLTTAGPIKASSESLTHAMIYECDADVNAVFHVHNKILWKHLLETLPSTHADVAYGTPEMALEIERLFRESDLAEHKIFAMGGHEDGVIAFGRSCEEAGSVLMEKFTDVLAQKLWDYHLMHHQLAKSDCILALGSHDLRVGHRAAELFLEGWAPLLIVSGGLGNVTKGIWTETEADQFAKIAIEKGVPPEAILIENGSGNTGENILFTQQLLKDRGLDPQRFIVVQKPYMERRSYAVFKKHWPEKTVQVTSPQISFEDYPNEEIPKHRVINIMAGDLQRIKLYPAKGFQIPQHIPDDVWQAFEKLVALGYTQHLIS